jgi:hypothetical protein
MPGIVLSGAPNMQRPPMVVFAFIHRVSGTCAACTMHAKKTPP